ncbi:PREDICTED: organic solute transporter subunit alpha-like [Polistes dominula]|uniref:Organic solute transporter subunit alpha-like n=1 Tax=Polistes dominula TaxID=743375 RepID=A0ABM1IFR9_POLDO|nr:PREDICTED: organic solute transporter subunit alpha-like [Polistes dominula]
MELSEKFHRLNVSCTPDYMPTAIENIESLGTFGIVLISVGAAFTMMTLYFAIDAIHNVFSQKETGLYKSNVVSIFSVYPIASVCSLMIIAIPRTQLLSEALIQIVLTISLYRLFLLLTDVGRRKNDKTAPLLLRTGPCCCWPCLPFPKLDMNDSRLAVIRLIVLQLPIVQGLLFFIMLVVALDEQKIEPSYLIWFQPFTLISILIGIYGLTITNKSLNVVAPEAKLRLKTLVTQLALVFSKLQAIIIKLLVYTGIFPCSPPLPPRVFANVTQSGLLIIEMLLLCIAARHLYYVDLEKEEDSSLKDRSNDKPHGLTNKNDLPEQLSNKIAVVTIS